MIAHRWPSYGFEQGDCHTGVMSNEPRRRNHQVPQFYLSRFADRAGRLVAYDRNSASRRITMGIKSSTRPRPRRSRSWPPTVSGIGGLGLCGALRRRRAAVVRAAGARGRRLGDQDARALLQSVIRAPLDDGVRDRIVAKTRSNPLALLELPREVGNQGDAHRADGVRGRLAEQLGRSRTPDPGLLPPRGPASPVGDNRGDPSATASAIMELVDNDDPPLRLFLGRVRSS